MDVVQSLRLDSYVVPDSVRLAAADEIERLRVSDDLRAEQAAWAEREACARHVEKLMSNMPEILLHLGEMTAQERRTCKALLLFLGHRIRDRRNYDR
jgi:uncharacterized membrane protein YccC